MIKTVKLMERAYFTVTGHGHKASPAQFGRAAIIARSFQCKMIDGRFKND
jgi:hypothetical protein